MSNLTLEEKRKRDSYPDRYFWEDAHGEWDEPDNLTKAAGKGNPNHDPDGKFGVGSGGKDTGAQQPKTKQVVTEAQQPTLSPQQQQAADALRDAEPEMQSAPVDVMPGQTSDKSLAALSKSEKQAVVDKISKQLGSTLKVSIQDEDVVGVTGGWRLGAFNTKTGEMKIFPKAFEMGEQTLRRTMAHEDMHSTVQKAFSEYDAQSEEAFNVGEHEGTQTYTNLKDVMEDNVDHYLSLSPVSSYAEFYKKEFDKSPNEEKYRTYLNETMAEVHAMHVTGRRKLVNSEWRDVYAKVMEGAGKKPWR